MPGAHPHDHGHTGDVIASGTSAGIRALAVSTAALGATAVLQIVIALVGQSVALLADALHNFGDVGTTVALWIALRTTRRAADREYTFGYQRLEDMAGLVVVAAMLGSAMLAAVESIRHLLRGTVPTHLALSLAAAVVGVGGNEAVAQIKIRTGRAIGSASLVAEGQHSRADALTSAGVVAGLVGVRLGARWADGAAGLLIAAAILWLGVRSARPVFARLADKVDPEIIEKIARLAASDDEVVSVHDIRARWAGRGLYVLLHVDVDGGSTLRRAHDVAQRVRVRVREVLDQVVQVDVHVDPFPDAGAHGDPQ